MRENYNMAFSMVLLSAVGGEILLFPVRVRRVENARTCSPTTTVI